MSDHDKCAEEVARLEPALATAERERDEAIKRATKAEADNKLWLMAADGLDRDGMAPLMAHKALQADRDSLRQQLEGAQGVIRGMVAAFVALANDDRPELATVNESIQAEVDAVIAERISLRQQLDEAKRALQNVKGLALRLSKKPATAEAASHLLRFCASAGVVPSVLRGALAQPKETKR